MLLCYQSRQIIHASIRYLKLLIWSYILLSSNRFDFLFEFKFISLKISVKTITLSEKIMHEIQGNHLDNRSNEQNDKLLSEFALTRRQSRSLYRNWVVLSKKSGRNSFQSQANVFSKISSSSIGNDIVGTIRSLSNNHMEDRAEEIVRHMEQSQTLMDDNPKSNNDRMETLREMTEYLTLKRSVKRKLIKSIDSTKTLSFSKRLKYRISIIFFKIPVAIRHFLSSFELWYSSLKVIEGHFGSSVASYFKFLRKLFLLNASIFIFMFFFIMVPQLLFRFIQFLESNENFTVKENVTLNNGTFTNLKNLNETLKSAPIVMIRSNPYQENGEFRLGNLFTGEGFLTNTILFYGYYTNTSLKLFENHSYSIPVSYFFTSALCYTLIFFFLFISVAVSYRKCYIEASGGMNNTFTNKVLCGWDFGIATKQAAELKSKSIYIEIKELLDDLQKQTKKKTCTNNFYTTAISFSLNGILLFLLGVGGTYSWKYLDQQMTKADTATTMMMWLILTLVIAIAPVLFSLIAHLEGFESPSSALYMTLIRTFTLYAVVIAVVMAYRLNRSAESECWETILGQDMYRLVVLDFIFGLIGTALSEFIRYRISIKMWKGIGCPEFDIARSTMNLIYNQTLFYIGLYFSPVLSFVITVKLFITFYIKKWGAVYNCKPFVKPWKASQAHTVYLSIAFFGFFCVIIANAYIITSVKTSTCGPFRGKKYMYESLLEEIIPKNDSTMLIVLYYITRPGTVGVALMAMLLGVYYMRAVALARILVVNYLRHLLRLKAEDRKLLLSKISKYSKDRKFYEFKEDSQNEESTFSGSDGEGTLDFNSINKSHKPYETFLKGEGEFINENEQMKKRRLSSFSYSKNGRNRCGVFNNMQNVNEYNLEDKKEVEYKFEESSQCLEKVRVETSFNFASTSVAENEREESFNKNSDNCTDQDLLKTFLKAEKSNEALTEDQSKIQRANFNPIFTESFPFHSDNEYQGVNDNTCIRLHPSNKLENVSQNCDENLKPNISSCTSYHRFEERVPSRISFDSEREQKIPKKKKRL